MHRSTIDLHLHSTASDGTLTPSELVEAASNAGVHIMALTDHDTVDGLTEAARAADERGLIVINGVELSVTWQRKTLHVVGLNIDPYHRTLREGLVNMRQRRMERAERIARKLERVGIPDALQGASKHAGDSIIARPHFARFLVERGIAKDTQDAFKRYLVRNKPAYVSTQWADLEDAIGWIRDAGGIAVLAHSVRYKLSGAWMRRVLIAFKDAGGQAIEVVCGNYTRAEIHTSVGYALRFELVGSVGSDFHGPSRMGCNLGKLAPLPESITPVWNMFAEIAISESVP